MVVRGQQLVGFWKGPAPRQTLRAALDRAGLDGSSGWLQLASGYHRVGKTDFALPSCARVGCPIARCASEGRLALQIVEMLTALRRRGVGWTTVLWDSRPPVTGRSL